MERRDFDTTAVQDYLSAQAGVCAAYVFGSQAKGTPTVFSDLDLAVLLDSTVPPSRYFEEQLRLEAELSKRLGRDDVDVVVLNRAGALLRFQIYRTGRALFERDRASAKRFLAHAIVEYLDFKPLKDRIEQAHLARLGP